MKKKTKPTALSINQVCPTCRCCNALSCAKFCKEAYHENRMIHCPCYVEAVAAT